MVDRSSRRQLAALLRQLAAGRMTNDEFERREPLESADPAIQAICSDGAWFLYDDLHEHRLIGKYRLDGRLRSDVARWVLFLETDIEYQWPIPPLWWRARACCGQSRDAGPVGGHHAPKESERSRFIRLAVSHGGCVRSCIKATAVLEWSRLTCGCTRRRPRGGVDDSTRR